MNCFPFENQRIMCNYAVHPQFSQPQIECYPSLNEVVKYTQDCFPVQIEGLYVLNCVPVEAQYYSIPDLSQYCLCEQSTLAEPMCNHKSNNSLCPTVDIETPTHMINKPLDLKSRNIVHNQTSETNLKNLEQLKDYPYSSEFRKSSKTGKLFIIYICEFDGCRKEFLRTWNLLDHVRMHQGVKPFVCDYCPKTFTQRGNLKKHLIKHYNPSIQARRNFSCKFCSSKFTERYNYKVSLSFHIKQLSSFLEIYQDVFSLNCSDCLL